jgi:hypothetical protein
LTQRGLFGIAIDPAVVNDADRWAIALEFNPAQARVDAGHAGGGQWTKDTSSLEFVEDLGGTTGAKLYRDPGTGEKYVLKTGKSEEHAMSELRANKLYEALGVPVPKSRMVLHGGKKALLNRWIDGKPWAKLTQAEQEAMRGQVRANFAADALLGNWDVTGQDMDNLLFKDGVAYRIDNGGALAFRAQGGPKGAKWDSAVNELSSMRKLQPAAQAFGDLTDVKVKMQVLGLNNKLAGLSSLPLGTDKVLHARINALKDFENGEKAWPWDKPFTTTAAAVVTVSEPSKQVSSGGLTHASFKQQVSELKSKLGPGWTETNLHQAAILNQPGESKVHVSWYWSDEHKEQVKALYHGKPVKVVEPSKVIKAKYGMTTKEVAQKLKDPSFGLVKPGTKPTGPKTKAPPHIATIVDPSLTDGLSPGEHVIDWPGHGPGGTKKVLVHAPATGEKDHRGFAKVSDFGTIPSAAEKGNMDEWKPAAEELYKKLNNEECAAVGSWKGSPSDIRASQLHGAVDLADEWHGGLKMKYGYILTDPALAKERHDKMKAFESACDKAPRYDGVLFRGVAHVKPGSAYHAALTTVGTEVELLASAGGSRSPAVAQSGFSGSSTMFRVRANDARVIERVSAHKDELESIMVKGSTYRVVGWTRDVYVEGHRNTKTLIDLEQVPPSPTAKKMVLSRRWPGWSDLALSRDDRSNHFVEDDPGRFMAVRLPLDSIFGMD